MKRNLLIIALLLLAFSAGTVAAQDGGKTISDDEVNTVANQLYCPVCENIPLDACETAACKEWREEIRVQLSEGQTEDQVIKNFVDRYGDRVVGTPQDPTLAAFSLVTPWVISALMLVGALWMFNRWRIEVNSEGQRTQAVAASTNNVERSTDEYRSRIERDLATRR